MDPSEKLVSGREHLKLFSLYFLIQIHALLNRRNRQEAQVLMCVLGRCDGQVNALSKEEPSLQEPLCLDGGHSAQTRDWLVGYRSP